MESSSQYNRAESKDFEEDPYFNEGDSQIQKPAEEEMLYPKQPGALTELLSMHVDEARKLNESIFNRLPTIKEEQNSIIKKLGDDSNLDIGKSNEYFVKVKAIEYLSSFLTIANIWNCIILYELDYYNDDGKNDKYVDAQLNISTFLSLWLTFLVNFR